MSRPVSANLSYLLPRACFSDSTLELYLRDGATKYFLTTRAEGLTIAGYSSPFLPGLIRVGDLTETLGNATNGVGVKAANPADVFSRMISNVSRPLELADVVIKSFKQDPNNQSVFAHAHYFTGKLARAETQEEKSNGVIIRTVSFDVIPDTTAAGVCIATRTLSPANGWRFPGIPVVELPSGGDGGGGSGGGGDVGGGGGGGDRRPPCFIAGTLIETPNGAIEIQNVKKGDAVYSFNPITFKVEKDSVGEVFEHLTDEILKLKFDDFTQVSTTEAHRFLTGRNEFTTAGKLIAGQAIYVKNGRTLGEVKLADKEYIAIDTLVYNFSVLKNQTYFADGFAVHNIKVIYD